jgi:thiamine-phosphate pyrophosphorylase
VDGVFPCLHVITDARQDRVPLDVVRAAIAAAVKLDAVDQIAVQVRVDDDVTDRQAYELTLAVLGLCRPAGVMCLVNDRLHIALAADADGVHVGADDLPVIAARRVLGSGPVLGATCRTPAVARAAIADGVTYLGVGPAYVTATKAGLPDPIGPAGVHAVVLAAATTPVIAIGGVTVATIPVLRAAGAHGVAVVGALADAADPEHAALALLTAAHR